MSAFQSCTNLSDIYRSLITSNRTDPALLLGTDPDVLGTGTLAASKAANLRAEQQVLQARANDRRRAFIMALTASNQHEDARVLQEAQASSLLLRQNTMRRADTPDILLNRTSTSALLSSACDIFDINACHPAFGVYPPAVRHPVAEVCVPAWNVMIRESPLQESFVANRVQSNLSGLGGMYQRDNEFDAFRTVPPERTMEKTVETKDVLEDEAAYFETPSSKERFPAKLYRMIFEMEQEGRSGVISFLPHGKAFAIHNEKVFVSEVLPRYFANCQLPSFQKQLNLYGFHKITVGKDKGKLRYFHASFLKGKPSLTEKIQRRRTCGAGKRK